MIKVPGSEQGYRAIERLVAQGYSINNTFCFSVSQAAAFFKAIHDGRFQAQRQGVSTEHARYVVSFMIGRLGGEDEIRQRLTNPERRWAELAVYQRIQALRRRWRTPARLLLCSLKVDTDSRGREHCWHLQRTGADTTLYTMTPHIIEFLARRQQQHRPIVPATDGVQVPEGVMHRLMSIDYWRQAYFEGGLMPREFARYPAFMTASRDARQGQQRLLDFVQAAGAGQQRLPIRTTSDQALERAS
jgi:transaldolase